jgi:hypothetical protein
MGTERNNRMTAYEALLELLMQAPPRTRVTSSDVNERVGTELSRQATHKAALRLQRQGYRVVGAHGRTGGYKMLDKGVRYGMGSH